MPTESDNTAAFRIIDANANRSLEGLRVVEDFARFALNDKHLAAQYKELRHELAAVLAILPQQALMASRHTTGDVGTEIAATGEYHRESLHDVAVAGQKRVEQALRCIEEYAKVVGAEVAPKIEQLRYRAYTAGKAIESTAASQAELASRHLYILLDGCQSAAAFATLATEICDAGADIVQLRDKRLSDRELVSRGHLLREIAQDTDTLFIMNDRPDIASIVRADGVHVGQDELSVPEARSILGPNKLVGVSTHSIEQARQAVLDGANYIGCGPTFPSETKAFDEFPGLAFLRAVSDEISLPAFAIGGINVDNLSDVRLAGFGRVAVSNCVTAAESPSNSVRQLRSACSKALPDVGAHS